MTIPSFHLTPSYTPVIATHGDRDLQETPHRTTSKRIRVEWGNTCPFFFHYPRLLVSTFLPRKNGFPDQYSVSCHPTLPLVFVEISEQFLASDLLSTSVLRSQFECGFARSVLKSSSYDSDETLTDEQHRHVPDFSSASQRTLPTDSLKGALPS